MSKENSKYHISWDEFFIDTIALYNKVKNKKFKGMVIITRGGLVAGAIFSSYYPIKNIEVIGIESYSKMDQKDTRANVLPVQAIKELGKDWLIIDELADTGNTIEYVKGILPYAYIATVYVKTQGKHLPNAYTKEFPKDTWLVFPWEQADEFV